MPNPIDKNDRIKLALALEKSNRPKLSGPKARELRLIFIRPSSAPRKLFEIFNIYRDLNEDIGSQFATASLIELRNWTSLLMKWSLVNSERIAVKSNFSATLIGKADARKKLASQP